MSPAALWGDWLRQALSLGLPPAAFWRLSLREWRLLLGPQGPGPLSRAEFAALTHRFPDEESHA